MQKAQKQQEEEQAQQEDAEVREATPARAAARRQGRGVRVCSWALPRPHTHCPSLQAHWVVEGARTRCVVIAEGDPPPGGGASSVGAVGRMSFGFNAQTDQLQAEAAEGERQATAAAAEAANPGGKSVSDEGMAVSLGQQRQQRPDGQQQQRGHHHKKHGQHGDGSQRGKKQRRSGEGDERDGLPKKTRGRYF